ncbi:MAG: DIP1984 family protein [Planctomycetota bacterium]
MKLAEALMIRGQMQTKLASLRQRLANNAVVQDGESPHEDPQALLAEAVGLLRDRSVLVARIHEANRAAALPDGRSMTEALALRDELSARHALVREAINATHKEVDRYSMREIKWVPAIDIAAMQKQADDLASRARVLNASIQQANWQVDLPD